MPDSKPSGGKVDLQSASSTETIYGGLSVMFHEWPRLPRFERWVSWLACRSSVFETPFFNLAQ
jgi:hypothetical protein